MAKEDPPILRKNFETLAQQAVNKWPDKESFVLPTKFGNAMRAFEVYPRKLYGIDMIPGLQRLFMVLPEQASKEAQTARAVLDFWINLFYGLSGTALVHLAYALCSNSTFAYLMTLGSGIIAIFCWYRLPSAASEYGEEVKTLFDLYRGDLAKKLGFSWPLRLEEERVLWRKFSQQIIFHADHAAFQLDEFKEGLSIDDNGPVPGT
jgi:hypothetical protein